ALAPQHHAQAENIPDGAWNAPDDSPRLVTGLAHFDRQLDDGQTRPLGANDQLGVEQVMVEPHPAYEVFQSRGTLPDFDAVRVADAQAEDEAQDQAEHARDPAAEPATLVGGEQQVLRTDDDLKACAQERRRIDQKLNIPVVDVEVDDGVT